MRWCKRYPASSAYLAYHGTMLLVRTLRLTTACHPSYQTDEPYLFCFWHGKQLLPMLHLQQHQTSVLALVSPSQDGNILAHYLAHLGCEVLRGSSMDNNIASLLRLVKALKQHYALGFAIDGPRGPIYQVKPGICYLAQKYQRKIVPIGSAFCDKWQLKAWDRFEIPKFFSRAHCFIGEPFNIPATMPLDDALALVTQRLHEAEEAAASHLLTASYTSRAEGETTL